MNRINPAKLLLSKWTAARPLRKEKHFLVTELFRDEEGTVLEIELQAVLTRRGERPAPPCPCPLLPTARPPTPAMRIASQGWDCGRCI